MDLGTLTGAGGTITIGGRTLTMRQLSVGDIGRIMAWVKERVPRPMQVAVREIQDLAPLKELDPEGYGKARDAILLAAREDAKAGKVGEPGDIDGAMQSIEGLAYAVWLSVRKMHPEVTFEWVQQAIDDEDLESIKKKIDGANKEWTKHLPNEGAAPPQA